MNDSLPLGKPARLQNPRETRAARVGARDREREAERFWAKVDCSGGSDACWAWTGAKTWNGYGRFKVFRNGRWTHVMAHRWAYEERHGPILPGIYPDHTCHTNDLSCPPGPCRHRLCVNPAHLDGTTDDEENRRRARARNTARKETAA